MKTAKELFEAMTIYNDEGYVPFQKHFGDRVSKELLRYLKDYRLLHSTTVRVFNHIRGCPGVHFRGIMKSLELSRSSMEIAITKLSIHGLIIVIERGKFKYYYPFGTESVSLFTPAQRKLIQYLKDNPDSPIHQMEKYFHLQKESVHYHLKQLRADGIVTRRLGDMNRHYYSVSEGV